MPPPKNAMEIYQHLDKSNCRECGEKTCLAFAGSVYTGRRSLAECPKLARKILQKFSGDPAKDRTPEAAKKIGADFKNGRLWLKIMGKDFSVDTDGNISTSIHVNAWVAVPFLNYILYGKGISPSGNWKSFRELEGGKEFYPLFRKRCEEPIKRIADVYTDLFDDLVHIFSGQKVEEQFESDISVVLYPLPKVPVMICSSTTQRIKISISIRSTRWGPVSHRCSKRFPFGMGDKIARRFYG